MNSRAWIEVNLDNLEFNIKQIQSKINDSTEIMAVVKANAYGHGDIIVAKKLSELGIKNFAVATLNEGIHLRENNIKGNILILGYTPEENYKELIEYDIIQTLVDEQYAKRLNDENTTQTKIKAHIKLNTGMNRIGIKPEEIDRIKDIYKLDKIEVAGIFSHLAVADEPNEAAIDFTNEQIEKFKECADTLQREGYNTGKLHIQNSYGTVYYSNYKFDYVRAGIFMYGIQDDEKDFKLKPVLSLKAKIETVNQITKNETVGYGRSYAANGNETIAAVSIGYADGYPRILSNQGTKVIVNGEYAEIIGRVCMDQLMIKIPNHVNVKAGDTVTLIGEENGKQVTASELAKRANIISYEILSALGARLDRRAV